MGSHGGSEVSKPVWAAGSQEERLLVTSEYMDQYAGGMTPETRQQIQSAIDALRMKSIAENNAIVGMGANGLPIGPYNPVDPAKVGTSTYSALNMQRQSALEALVKHSMQEPGQRAVARGGKTSWAGSLVKGVGTLAASIYGGQQGQDAAQNANAEW